ncbi:MAG: archaetidylserine decarboxylase [Spirochaetota bacterium]
MKRQLLVFLFRIMPKSLFSRIFGHLSRIPLGGKILGYIIQRYSAAYGVKTEEIIPVEGGFRTFDQFFTRRVKPGTHRIDQDPRAVVSPVDARIDQFGEITGTRIMQAKDIDYLVSELIPAPIHHTFLDGTFVTLYLSPGDYHRIHSPMDGFVNGFLHVPGTLFPVMEFAVNGINGLFSINERLVTYLRNEKGYCAVCKIGAMNVGRISASYSGVVTNRHAFRKKREVIFPQDFRPQIRKGDELGIFHLGSTVVLLFQKDMINLDKLSFGQKVRMGQRIGTLK